MARLSRFAPNRQRRRGSSAGLFSPCGLKTLNLQGRSPRLRPEPPAAVRGYDRLIGPKSQTWGLQKLRPMPPFGGRGYGGLIFVLWTQNAQPTGALTRPLRRRTPFGFAPNRHRRRGVSTGLFSSSGLKTRGLQELRSLRGRTHRRCGLQRKGVLQAESPPAHKRCAGGLGVLGATRGPPCPRRKGAWRAFRPARRRASAGGYR